MGNGKFGGGGSFGGGGFGGGGDGSHRGPAEGLGKVNTQVVPGIESPGRGAEGMAPRNVVPGDDRTLVIPGEQAPIQGATDSALQSVVQIAVFARFQRTEGEQLAKDLGYLHAASGRDFHLVLAGYSRTPPETSGDRLSDPKAVQLATGVTWYYDDIGFNRQIEMVEHATMWKYRGGFQLVICDVTVPGGRPVGIQEMFVNGRGNLEHCIVIDVDELKESKLFADFDRFFNALRTMIQELRSDGETRLTWALSDRLALTQDGVLIKLIVKAFKLDIPEAWESAKSLKNFAVRNLRRKTPPPK